MPSTNSPCVMPMRLAAILIALSTLSLPSLPAFGAPLAGTYTSPLGVVSVSEKEGSVVAKIVDAQKNPCGFPKGHDVFEGSRLDDSLIGTLHACKIGDGCAGPIDGDAMLLITRGGAVISGAVHLAAGTCKTPIGGDSVVFKKGAASPSPTSRPAKDKTPPRVKAERIAADAFRKYQQDGNAEEARAAFMEAIKIDPAYAEGYIGVGMTYRVRDRFEEALEWYKKAIEANPAVGDAYYNIACIYALRNDTEQALRYLRIALLNGYVQTETMSHDEDLKSLEGNPVFEKLKRGQMD